MEDSKRNFKMKQNKQKGQGGRSKFNGIYKKIAHH